MSRNKSQKVPELPLFDLPLYTNDEAKDGDAAAAEPVAEPVPQPPPGEPGEELSLFALDGAEATPPSSTKTKKKAGKKAGKKTDAKPEAVPAEPAEDGSEDPADAVPASFGDRVLSGLLDLGIQLLVLGTAAGGVLAMGVTVGLGDWGPFTLLTLVFSFLYWFIPLAFWGQTPGMAWVGNAASGLGGEPLTFGQTTLRWVGALLTLALFGLPLFLVLGGRSLTDRLSESKTVVA